MADTAAVLLCPVLADSSFGKQKCVYNPDPQSARASPATIGTRGRGTHSVNREQGMNGDVSQIRIRLLSTLPDAFKEEDW
jgi:hypothetical protein